MAELVPIPLHHLLKRAFLEYQREGKIFDLPKSKFFLGLPGLDTSVSFHGHRASTPLGPAAGPHDQLAQNIVLCWLGGARIIELKTVQVLDELHVPRPCIDAANVAYNVEWSQELRLEQSLREYVGASMFIEILKASKLIGEDIPGDTVFDMSVGYNLEGIRSPRVRGWIASMKDASVIIDELRHELTGAFAQYRDVPFNTRIGDTITLSTFHGCPAGEIEGIVEFLTSEMDVDVCVKLNPTLLGKEQVGYLLHDVLGYSEIRLAQDAFEKDLQFDEALDLIPRIERLARRHGKSLSVKLSNTLVVKNHREVFADDVMYMSGPPLHVVTMNLVKKLRDYIGSTVPMSFSAGLDAHNIANAVAMNLVPVTTCTDLLRPGGYSRLVRYLENLGAKMNEICVTHIPDFVVRYTGRAATVVDRVAGKMGLAPDARQKLEAWLGTPEVLLATVCSPEVAAALVDAAGLLNTPKLVEQATENPRYSWAHNRAVPRKIGEKLWLYDCINCDKCIPACPNDANFVYEGPSDIIDYNDVELLPGGAVRAVPGGALVLVHGQQLANYADVCNECGNCDTLCPEDGGPYITKPRFFGSLGTYYRYAGRNGFYMALTSGHRTIYGTIDGKSYRLAFEGDRACFDDGVAEIDVQPGTNQALTWKPKPGAPGNLRTVDMLPYLQLKLMLESASDPKHVHFANVAGLPDDPTAPTRVPTSRTPAPDSTPVGHTPFGTARVSKRPDFRGDRN